MSEKKVKTTMDVRLFLTLVAFFHSATYQKTEQTIFKIATKKTNNRKLLEDYSFKGALNKANEECSNIFQVNDTASRKKTIQVIKEKVMNRKVKEFYEQKEKEKQRSKQYYENVKRESRRKIMESENMNWKIPSSRPGRIINKRFSKSNRGRRRKNSNGSSKVTFTDHNNCSSRCILTRMEVVDSFGFPDESLIIKLIDDKITNRKIRFKKKKKVASCFRKMQEVTFDDSCIFSAKLFDCLQLGDSYLWSSP